MSRSRALSATFIALLTTLALAGSALAKEEEPTAAVVITPGGPDQPTIVDVELMAGEEPFPVDTRAAVLIRATHRVTGEVVEATAASTGVVGAYTASLDLAEPGGWLIEVRGRYGSDTWTFRTTTGAELTPITLADPGAAAADAAEAAGAAETASTSGSTAPSPLIGIGALLAAALLAAIGVVATRRRGATSPA